MTDVSAAESLNTVLSAIGSPTWDLLMVGDGSGSGWSQPVGWSVIFIDRATGIKRMLTGGANHGTINAVELFPYLWAVRYHYYFLNSGKLNGVVKTHIITDSEVTSRCGSGHYAQKANQDLWSLVDFWKVKGYDFTWHWMPAHEEGELMVHRLADTIAADSRLSFLAAPPSDELNDVLV